MPDFLHDGNYLRADAVGAPRFEYPFRKNGDRVTALFEQEYWQTRATWTPQEFAIPHETMRDFYLVKESEPVEFMAGLYRFNRTYSRIPLTQTDHSDTLVTKPALSGTFPAVIGESLVLQPDPTVPVFKFYSNKLVTSDSGAPSSDVPTGGTYTVTVGSTTTAAIAYDASAATLQTALNGLTGVSQRGTVTVTGSYNGINSSRWSSDPLTQFAGFEIHFTPFSAGSITSSLTGPAAVSQSVVVVNSWTMIFTVSALGTAFTGGTYTITIFGQTTAAIAYNASAATTLAAIAALTNVGTATLYAPAIPGWGSNPLRASDSREIKFFLEVTRRTTSASAASLTPSGSTATASTIFAPWAFVPDFQLSFNGVALATRAIYSAGHGLSDADNIVVYQGGLAIEVAAGLFSVTGPDTLQFTAAAGGVFSGSEAITAVGKFTSTYTGGTVRTRVKLISDFYLPGVSPGITTVDDIPLAEFQGDPDSLLAAILAASPEINYEVGQLGRWRESPILFRTRMVLNAATL